jgi:hypothetical protein
MKSGLNDDWPELLFSQWKDTCATLHLWTQIVGKFRLVQSPWINHSWHATFYVTTRGFTTSPIPYRSNPFEIHFDFIAHNVVIQCADGRTERLELRSRSVADFYGELIAKLKSLGIEITIHPIPNEMEVAIPFHEDHEHATYDAVSANRFWHAVLHADRVFKLFRSRFLGKCSPVHFFWGSFDLAVTRFSGRKAPEHPGNVPHLPDWVAKEAYSHEVSSCGFWPGSEQVPFAAFYAYAYPEPSGFKESKVLPAEASYHPVLREFLLPYDAVRTSTQPDKMLLDFMQSTYEAAADLANWDRMALEKR